MNWKVEINIDEAFIEKADEGRLRHVVEQVMRAESVDINTEVSLLVTGDETMTELNRTYRGMDGTTDVLSFAFQEDREFPAHPEGVTQLGEVIISLPQAERQAVERGHSLDRELTVLIIHGVLHLLGYDHQNDEEEERMTGREQRVLARLETETG